MKATLYALALLTAMGCSAPTTSHRPKQSRETTDELIQAYLMRSVRRIEGSADPNASSAAAWRRARPRYKEQLLDMLGLWPMPPKTPLSATITGSFRGEGFVVEMVHFQSRPRLYVTGNIFRPSNVASGVKLPAVLYLSGHSSRGRNGNKTGYQSHGIWFARHGYVCLLRSR